MTIDLRHGDCRDVLATLEAESIDACVTDPPYHLQSIVKRFGGENATPAKGGVYARSSAGFMGKTWDGGDVAMSPETWAEVARVLKPGAHLAAFGGTRTFHRVAVAIEDAGFEIRDTLCWLYGSGFPKSHNQPGGWGTALKPAWEPIILARKPVSATTVAGNMAAHGTGALNIDGCRIGAGADKASGGNSGQEKAQALHDGGIKVSAATDYTLGRWPANVAHDGSDEVLEAFARFGESKSTGGGGRKTSIGLPGETRQGAEYPKEIGFGDTGTAARFFYEAKASREERGEGNNHPTVKPIALMRWLCRMVTPIGGTILDPFLGSGSTAIAADQEGFSCIGIEQSAEYLEIARRRIAADAPLLAEIA